MLTDKRGIALLIITGVVFALLILGGAILTLSTGQFGTSFHLVNRTRAYFALEAARQHALWKCRIPPPNGYDLSPSASFPINDSVTINDPNYSFSVDIRVYAEGTQGAPAGTYRIDLKIPNY